MGKLNGKINAEVAALASKEGRKGKRQQLEAETETQPLSKKLKSATKVPQKKKHETSSSSEEDSDSEEEVKLPVKKKPNLVKKLPKQSSSSEEDSSDEEPVIKKAAPAKKMPAIAKNGSVTALKNGKTESSDSSESESEEEKSPIKRPLQTKAAGKVITAKGKPVEESSEDDSSEDESSDEEPVAKVTQPNKKSSKPGISKGIQGPTNSKGHSCKVC